MLLPYPLYGYRKTDSSITNSAKGNWKCIDHIWVAKAAVEEMQRQKISLSPEDYRYFLYHFSLLAYRRTAILGERALQCEFAVAKEILQEISYVRPDQMSRTELHVEKAMMKQDLSTWKFYQFMMELPLQK